MGAIAYVTDLIFRTKITSTAASLGADVVVAGSAEMLQAALSAGRPRLVIVDLDAAGDVMEAIRCARATAPAAQLLAYASHVQADRMAAARAAGAQEVLARSAFVQRLPAMLEATRPAPDTAEASTKSPAVAPSRCPRCGAAVLARRHCKLLCESCGYVESCEDLF